MEDVSRPTADELKVNSRARSALLHVFQKQKGVRMSQLEALAYPLFGWPLPERTSPPPVEPPATLQDGIVRIENNIMGVACGTPIKKSATMKKNKTDSSNRKKSGIPKSNWDLLKKNISNGQPKRKKKKKKKLSALKRAKKRAAEVAALKNIDL